MNRILLVEDNASSQALVRHALGGLAHELTVAETAGQALGLLERLPFALIILDMGLPDQDGLELCSRIQASERTRQVPIFVLTGREEVSSKIAAFSIGVEDYIVKPFSPLELRARIEARLKRLETAAERDDVLARGELRLNVSKQRCYQVRGQEELNLGLTSLEFRLLYQLARREEHVFSREQLLDQVWGDSSEVLDRTVDAHISVLRRKLGELASYLQSSHGQGYFFSSKKARPTGEM